MLQSLITASIFSNYLNENVNINSKEKKAEGKCMYMLKGNNQNLTLLLSGDGHSIPKPVLNATRSKAL